LGFQGWETVELLRAARIPHAWFDDRDRPDGADVLVEAHFELHGLGDDELRMKLKARAALRALLAEQRV
jgi:hypothetical protein